MSSLFFFLYGGSGSRRIALARSPPSPTFLLKSPERMLRVLFSGNLSVSSPPFLDALLPLHWSSILRNALVSSCPGVEHVLCLRASRPSLFGVFMIELGLFIPEAGRPFFFFFRKYSSRSLLFPPHWPFSETPSFIRLSSATLFCPVVPRYRFFASTPPLWLLG